MSKYDAGQLNFAALCIDGKKIVADHGGLVAELDGTVVADMLREYAAHPARQSEGVSEEDVARLFHDEYERLAPSFGYETREETRVFDAGSANGKLMIAVCRNMRAALTAVWHNRPAQEPSEGHSVRVLSQDGDWEGEARWEYQESAYVTQEAVRPAKEKATNYVSGHADSTGKFHATAQEKAEPVATVESVRAELVRKIGDCCQGGDPLCAGGCLAEIAAKRNAARSAPPPAAGVPDAFAPIPECTRAPTHELWDAYQAFNYAYRGMNTQQALRAAINGVLANRARIYAELSATPSPAIDVAVVREVIEGMRCVSRLAGENDLRLRDTCAGAADKLARAIGDAK
jgi:hypothetical protein